MTTPEAISVVSGVAALCSLVLSPVLAYVVHSALHGERIRQLQKTDDKRGEELASMREELKAAGMKLTRVEALLEEQGKLLKELRGGV